MRLDHNDIFWVVRVAQNGSMPVYASVIIDGTQKGSSNGMFPLKNKENTVQIDLENSTKRICVTHDGLYGFSCARFGNRGMLLLFLAEVSPTWDRSYSRLRKGPQFRTFHARFQRNFVRKTVLGDVPDAQQRELCFCRSVRWTCRFPTWVYVEVLPCRGIWQSVCAFPPI